MELADGNFLLAASNRTHKTIDLFRARPGSDHFAFERAIPLQLEDPYGLCMAATDNGIAVFVGDSEGIVEHWLLGNVPAADERLRQYRFDSQTEGCVMDTQTGDLYIGEEAAGVWRIDPASGERTLVDAIAESPLVADVEGLDIYYGDDRRYLVASSQGDDS